jgi:hypothetical protein
MRRDTLKLVLQAISEGRSLYTLVNNRAEDNAPLMVQAIVDRLSVNTSAYWLLINEMNKIGAEGGFDSGLILTSRDWREIYKL